MTGVYSLADDGSQAGHESVLQYFLWCDAFCRFKMKHFLQQGHKKD